MIANSDDYDCLEIALGAAVWIEGTAVELERGIGWPLDIRRPVAFPPDLYHGTAGVVVFLLEAWHVTGEERWLDLACRGCQYLTWAVDMDLFAENQRAAGLYSGYAGVGFALVEAWRATGRDDFRSAAEAATGRVGDLCAHHLRRLTRDAPQSGLLTLRFEDIDVTTGLSGAGLFLLYADQSLHTDSHDLLAGIGQHLVRTAHRTDDGLEWIVSDADRLVCIPNFAHGAAGIAYFLCSYAMVADDPVALGASRDAAMRLMSIADCSDDGCRLPQRMATDLSVDDRRYAVGWCHGPAGTGALWRRLYQATGDPEYLRWLRRSANTILGLRVDDRNPRSTPTSASDPHWRNPCYCHGLAGNADFLLSVSRCMDRAEFGVVAASYLRYCAKIAIPQRQGCSWLQVGNVTLNDRGQALVNDWCPRSGFSLGSSGIGYALLNGHCGLNDKARTVWLPDSPFGENGGHPNYSVERR